ncbi:DUF5324 family protein [Streptomyces sp. NRRL WC-3742]|uniref:DUF5324 family protein n=1 Tax=Streptomyces sp. NRRL WC-3742 TaxID=1463934 RepID=UPI00068ADF24|nr:DUF5324 family protein [Streptomyces sp. NRRL WC-3742]
MTLTDTARETATRTMDTAAHFADGARQRLGPALDALGPKAGHAAHALRAQYGKHLAPQVGQAFASLPPEAQQNALKALHRAQEAALAARVSAGRAADQARSTVAPRVIQAVEEARAAVTPVAQEAQSRGAAALTALQGHVSSAEISDLAARNARRERRCRSWTTGLAVAGVLAVGGGLVAWQWWRRHSNPEWLVEPPQEQSPRPAGAHAASAPLNGSPTAGDAPGTAAEPDTEPGTDDGNGPQPQ